MKKHIVDFRSTVDHPNGQARVFERELTAAEVEQQKADAARKAEKDAVRKITKERRQALERVRERLINEELLKGERGA